MEGVQRPLKKQRVFQATPLHFQLILPYLFPGYYGKDWRLAFRTALALCGTCVKLRYWNVLRRWVAYLAPDNVKKNLRTHSFPCSATLAEMDATQMRCQRLLEDNGYLNDAFHPTFTSQIVLNNFWKVNQSNKSYQARQQMEIHLGGSSFHGMVRCDVNTHGAVRDRVIHCFPASDFSEMVLFAYAATRDNPPLKNVAYCLIATWKTQKYEFIYFSEEEKLKFRDRYLLGRLKRIGLTAPQEIGFHHGQLPETSYSWFCRHCDTTGTRNRLSMEERLHNFVSTWFPNKIRPAENEREFLPYDFAFLSV